MKIYSCLYCNKAVKFGKAKVNKYCSNICQGKHSFETKTLSQFFLGLLSERPILRKCLAHLFGYKCSECLISEWNNKPITLQVDHIDGNAGNNNPNNVRLLCPNCHSQTKTFSGGNKGSGRKARGLKLN